MSLKQAYTCPITDCHESADWSSGNLELTSSLQGKSNQLSGEDRSTDLHHSDMARFDITKGEGLCNG